ncbi:insulin receptor substrate 1 chico isoform X5 [Anticarsia gemmatalis]|uniref:insulin receptor substrate 1 chico isoform X5 n=1 Tax=Anticarsia gemmatalis TaxID=129554 RepID=UPI003F75B840
MSASVGGGAGAVVRQGHLRKLKTMKKKFFVLRAETTDCSARLEYYESEKKFRAGASARRVLALKSCYNIMRRLDLKQKHVIALFTREEQFCIVAENEQELHAWLTAILKQHRSDDASEELLHPIQHVWQVNVQKKGLGATKNIQGLYNLCLTDKTLTLVKIKSHNNVISDLGIPERVEYSLKNIRRCGDSECFFYMEVGRQTTTGAGELWMHTDDSNIAQSMHSTIYHAMRNCARETENERDHIVLGAAEPLPARRQTYSDGRGRAGLSDAGTLRNRCDSMPSRSCSSFEVERPPARFNNDLEGPEVSRDEADAMVEWYRTPRIPEEPDCCDISRDFMNASLISGSSVAHSRTSSVGEAGYMCMEAGAGYLPMAPGHDPLAGLVSASSGSLCSGTPSTDPRFSEYQLEPATSHIGMESRPPRAYSVGSRPAATGAAPEAGRHRAYSVGARARPPRHPHPRQTEDHMEIDFSNNSPANRPSFQVSSVARTPPIACFADRPKTNVDEYVDMSPRNAGYVEMRPGEPPAPVTDGYVEMNYGRAPTRPIAINTARPERITRVSAAASPDEPRKRATPHGSQTLFDLSLDSPADPLDATPATPPIDLTPLADEPVHALTTVNELSEDGRKSPDVAASPQYVTLAPRREEKDELSCNPTANKTIARLPDLADSRAETTTTATLVVAGVSGAGGARFSVEAPLNYAALDLEPRRAAPAPTRPAYTQIDFLRSDKLHADAT